NTEPAHPLLAPDHGGWYTARLCAIPNPVRRPGRGGGSPVRTGGSREESMIDVVGNRKWYFLISGLVLIPGIVALLLGGLRLGVDFTGGSLWEMRFANGAPSQNELYSIFANANPPHREALIQQSGSDTLLVRTTQIQEGSEEKAALATEIRGRF